jgi:hypothetical protein
MLEDFIKYILGEWRTIAQAPVSFFLSVLVLGIIIWAVMNWGYGREMSLLRQQVADYKDRLSMVFPKEAKKADSQAPINISFEYENRVPFLQPDNTNTIWIRVRALNTGEKDSVCRVYLSRLEKDGEATPLWHDDDLQLRWAGKEFESPGNIERTIPAGQGRIFNLGFIKKDSGELTIQNPQFALQVTKKLSPGIYHFTIQASHISCRSKPTKITVKYNGQQDASFVK